MEIKEVFEPVVSFIKNFQKKEKDISKQAAKDRLKLVLMQDRASVSPDFFEMMKKEIIDVIKKYIEIDEESLEVQLTRGYEAGLEGPALYANIPIKNIKPVASSDEDDIPDDMMSDIANVIADEISEEVSKVTDSENTIVTAEIESAPVEEVKEEVELKVEDIAKNVSAEMKKSTRTANNAKIAKAVTKKKSSSSKSTSNKSTSTKSTK